MFVISWLQVRLLGGKYTFEEDVSCFGVRGNALEEGEGIADSI